MPKVLKITQIPEKILRQKAKEVVDATAPEIAELIENMVVTMRQAKGIGLAAPQVGIGLRVIIIETKDGAMSFINPEIVKASKKMEIGEEGCLSIPNTFGQVKRHESVTVKSLDTKGEEQMHDARGMFARVFQHEIDHINGVLFIDKMETPEEKK